MKVLVVISKYLPEYSGAAFRIHKLYHTMLQHNPHIEIEVICGGVEYQKAETYVHEGITIHRVPNRAQKSKMQLRRAIGEWFEILQTWRILKKKNPDVIHLVATAPVVAAAQHYAFFHDIPVLRELVTKNAPLSLGLPIVGKFWKPPLHNRSIIAVISKGLRDHVARQGYTKNLWFRLNPVDTDQFFPDPDNRLSARAAISPFQPTDKLIGSIANFTPQKNQVFLLDVLAYLPPHFKLLLAGPYVTQGLYGARNQDYMQTIQNKIIALGLQDRVHIHAGFVDASQYMKALDIYAMPNYHEGLGTPLLEALACGIPVIANAAEEAFCDVFAEISLGFLCPLDPQKWAQAALKCLSTSPERKTAAADYIQKNVALNAYVRNYQKVLSALAQSTPQEVLKIETIL